MVSGGERGTEFCCRLQELRPLGRPQIDDIAIQIPEDRPVYNLRDLAPGLVEPRSEDLERMLEHGEEHFFQTLDKARNSHLSLASVCQWC